MASTRRTRCSPGVGALAMFGISVLIYLTAYRMRLPADRVRELIDEAAEPASGR